MSDDLETLRLKFADPQAAKLKEINSLYERLLFVVSELDDLQTRAYMLNSKYSYTEQLPLYNKSDRASQHLLSAHLKALKALDQALMLWALELRELNKED